MDSLIAKVLQLIILYQYHKFSYPNSSDMIIKVLFLFQDNSCHIYLRRQYTKVNLLSNLMPK